MVRRALGHRLFAPGLVIATFAWGSALVGFLLVGPGLGAWADTLLGVCFGWNAATRHYRLDALIVALLQPPLFVGVVAILYWDDVRAFLHTGAGRTAGLLAAGVFVSLAGYFLATTEVSGSGTPPRAPALTTPIRQGTPAPAFALVNHRSQPVSRETFRGRPVVLTFVYANCHASCPALIARLKALEAHQMREAAPVAFVVVSLDPERDTPPALAEHAARLGLGARWHLLTGEPGAVRKLVGAYGVQWAPLPDGEIVHENVVILIDRAGRMAFRYRGLAYPEEQIAGDLARLLAEPV